MRRLLLVAVLLLMLMSLPVIGSAQDEQPPVILAIGIQPDTMMADFARFAISGYTYELIYNRLVKPSPDGIIPDLATSWTISDDLLTWTFSLRDDVTWHDGTPFTANDVKFYYEYISDPEYPGLASSAQIQGGTEKQSGEAEEVSGVQVIDDYTISITTVEPNALLLDGLAATFILPAHILSQTPVADIATSPQATSPVGTGPYRLTQWLQDESLTFEANENYFDGPPGVNTVIWRVLPETSTQITELLVGGINVMPAVPVDDVPALEAEEGLTVQTFIGTGVNYLIPNHTLPQFQDVRVRTAIAHAMDVQTLLDVANGGLGVAGLSQVFPEIPEANTDLTGFAYDPELARSLLAEAGWRDEDGNGVVESYGVEGLEDGTPFSVRLATFVTPAFANRAQVIQQFLADVGIETQLETLDSGLLIGQLLEGNYDLTFSGWVNLLIPTLSDLASWFQSDGNYGPAIGWSNEELDTLIDEIPTIFDDDARVAAFWRIQEIVEDDVVVIYADRSFVVAAFAANLFIPEVGSNVEFYRSIPTWEWLD